MEKENKVSPVSWIMEWAGTKKIYYVISIIMALFSVLFKIAPYFIIGDVIAKLLDGEDDIKVYAVRVGLVAAAFVLSEIFHSISTKLAHILPEFTSNLVAPVIVIIYLFVIDWRMALITFIPMVLGFAATCGMFIGYEENFNNTVEKTKVLNESAVEYINGMIP